MDRRNTTPTDLGTLGGSNSDATAVSADGSVIVGWSNTSAGPTHAYDENADADFPARYDRLTSDLATATLSLGGERPIGDRQRIGLNAGVVADLHYGKAGLGGTSSIPGLGTISQAETLARNEVRPFVAATYATDLNAHSTLHAGAGVSRPAYGGKPAFSLEIGYGAMF